MRQEWKLVEYLTLVYCVRLSRVELTKRAANDVTEAPMSMKLSSFVSHFFVVSLFYNALDIYNDYYNHYRT